MESNGAPSVKIGFVQKIGEGEFETEAIWCEIPRSRTNPFVWYY